MRSFSVGLFLLASCTGASDAVRDDSPEAVPIVQAAEQEQPGEDREEPQREQKQQQQTQAGAPKATLVAAPKAGSVSFSRDIRPILSDNCFACHGPDPDTRKAGLRLDVFEAAVDKQRGRPAIVPGDPDASGMVRRIGSPQPGLVMPPPATGKTVRPEQLALISDWIRQGAGYEPHWAYVGPERPPEPEVRDADWVRNPIDRFILARLEAAGVTPAPVAEPHVLLRRVYFDLIGLPPTPDDLDRFLADESADAFEREVDRLLESVHYGERMAIHWLDLVRYADTVGFHGDQPVPVSPYRDYVIDAFNENMPFDQFTREQLAGDLLPDATVRQRVAAAYNRLNRMTAEGGAQAKEYLAVYAADRVRTTASAWLASTMACAECHTHKFDPTTIEDFYRFAAFFADIEERGVYDGSGTDFPPYMETESGEKVLATVAATPRVTRVLPRGNWMDDSGEVVEPGVPHFLPPIERGDAERRLTRLDLANWLVARDNPLTARAFVNRKWQQLFGTGLSRVLDDLGMQGEYPEHRELLDWLAVEFMDSGWDMKHMMRLMVTSAAYRRSSTPTREQFAADPLNRLHARQARPRLPAELVRDVILHVSGLLEPKVGGPSVMPYQPAGYYAELNFPKREYEQSTGPDQYRRGLYTHWQRTFLHPQLAAFDAPQREECTAQRPASNTPMQALVLLNDPSNVEAARVFAERIVRTGGDTPEARLTFAFRLALAREPATKERDALLGLLASRQEHFAGREDEAKQLISVGQHPAADDLDPAELAAWTMVARVLFNVQELFVRY
jgi:mono/diheme cytochrome c family protein